MANTNIDANFLTPRGLLLESGQCCFQASSFDELGKYVQLGLGLPRSKDEVKEQTGMDEVVYNVSVRFGLDRIVLYFKKVNSECVQLSSTFELIHGLCEQTVALAADAKETYAEIFAILKEIYEDPTSNQRPVVKALVDQQLQLINKLGATASDATSVIRQSISTILQEQEDGELEDLHEVYGAGLEFVIITLIFNQLPIENLGPVVAILETMEHLIGMDISGSVLTDLELFLGGWDAISNDLKFLAELIGNNTDPMPDLVAHLEEEAILKQWALLRDEVNKFDQEHLVPSLAAFNRIVEKRVEGVADG